MNKRWFYPTNEGFPQGSPISPSLANLALNNLQESIGKEFLSTRYADDFIVLGKNKKELEEIALPRIKKFLEVRGLKLSLEKTYITDISKGFDFLGYNFREYPDKNRIKGIKQGIFLVKPSHKKVKDFKRDLSLTVRKYRKASMYLLIQTLNQKLRGWSEHYRTVTSQKMFSSISYHLWQICWKMLRKRHRRRPAKYLIKKYFTKVDGNKWIFRCEHSNKKDELTLFQIPYVPLKRHLIVKNINPYDPENYEYFEKRIASSSRHSVLLIRAKGKLLQNQKGICPICKNYLLNGENLDVHHIKSRKDGGSDNTSNLLLLHNECRKQVTYSKNKDFKAIWLKEGIIK